MSDEPTQNRYEEAYKALMGALTELDLQGPHIPSDLVLNGEHAFPLAMNSQGQVLMAASLYGSGRIVVLGHEGYLTAFPALVENALTWLRGDGSDNLSVGVHDNVKGVADNLSESSFQVTVVGAFSENKEVGVYVTDACSVGPDVKELVAFLKAGGGVLIAGEAWSWAADQPKANTLVNFEGNKVSAVAGIYFTEHQGEVECVPVHPQIPFSWKAVEVGKDFGDDLELLLEGVSEFGLRGAVTSEILVHGPLAFPIGTTKDGRPFLAGCYYGKGRVVVITHEGLLCRETLAPFWNNALRWLDDGRNGVVGFAPKLGKAFNLLSKSEFNCEKTNFKEDLSVFVTTLYSDKEVEELQAFVAEGGGLLLGGHAWYWAQTNRGKDIMIDFEGNKILNKMGLSILGNTIWPGSFKAPVPGEAGKESYHFRQLLHCFGGHVTQGEELTEHQEECLKKLGGDCHRYLNWKAHDCPRYTQVVSSLTEIMKKSDMPQVCVDSPVKDPSEHLLLKVGAAIFKASPEPEEILAFFIKDIPSLPVVNDHKVKVNADTAGAEEWLSTGLYLSPGMTTNIVVPAEIVNKGWKIQIGCQTDYLKAQVLKRAPRVHERFSVYSETVEVSNLWGGLIYLVAPPRTQMEGVEVTVQTAILAPYYNSGVTTADDWATLRSAPAPWAELEFENIVFTVPSDAVRDLDRPEELAALWDSIMRGVADLAAKPQKLPRKQRFVTDVQISVGLMHSGYPIMAHTPAAAQLVMIDPTKRNLWGPFHELGHNQQRGCWEFPPHTTEGTCNLWSVYLHEEVLGIDRAEAHPAMALQKRIKRTEAYVEGGRILSKWTSWVALETYLQLQAKFGWDALKKVFAAYHEMSKFPKDKIGKMNLYAETLSQTVGMNLVGFLKAWGWPINAATEEKLADLPPWSDHPMVQYD